MILENNLGKLLTFSLNISLPDKENRGSMSVLETHLSQSKCTLIEPNDFKQKIQGFVATITWKALIYGSKEIHNLKSCTNPRNLTIKLENLTNGWIV